MALYYPPVKPNAPIYSYQNFAAPNTPISPAQGGSSVTEEWLSTHYLQFPNAQGVENFGFQELNNHDWQVKCRKETKVYKF